eukprot:NODE_2807_length_2141_cov_7.234359.p1 GENE.NODE_2807_length_2141_cov_7.234359~~NODE_2807_length_2141_cov_7.234359.p1  ORF type:complete len:520 (-),score=121.78 NODE_2807_length_2141_cov_7.234359:489-2048(-)
MGMETDAAAVMMEYEVQARVCTFQQSDLRWVPTGEASVAVSLTRSAPGAALTVAVGVQQAPLADVLTVSQPGPCFLALHISSLGHIGLAFETRASASGLADQIARHKSDYERFKFLEPNSLQTYFQYYAKLGNQQNMLQDIVRTSTYQRAITENFSDFRGRTVMDVGAGSGILSFFAAQAGASTVYAVEASVMAEVIRIIADSNNFPSTTFHVVNKPLENILEEVPTKVDVLVSEPLGTFLFNERMIETYLKARDRFLKPGGKMFPNAANLCIAPFSDPMLHWEQQNKNTFWKNSNFYGVDLTAVAERCTREHFRQPVVDYINPECLVASCQTKHFDFTTIPVESLREVDLPFDFEIQQPCLVHGIAGWFDALFEGSTSRVPLSTAPWSPGTHWYQIRFLVEVPLALNAGQHLEGHIHMVANSVQAYDVRVQMRIKGTNYLSEAPKLDLKDPEYRFYTSPYTYCPPGSQSAFGQQQQQQQAQPVFPPMQPNPHLEQYHQQQQQQQQHQHQSATPQVPVQ